MFFFFLIPSSSSGFQSLNCFDILGDIMNWTLPQMLPVTEHDPPLGGRWELSDSLMAKQNKTHSKGGSGETNFSLCSPPPNSTSKPWSHPSRVPTPPPHSSQQRAGPPCTGAAPEWSVCTFPPTSHMEMCTPAPKMGAHACRDFGS